MRKSLLSSTALLAACFAGAAWAQEAPPPAAPAEAAPAASAQSGTLVFPPAFFAEAQPNTAADMVARVPGFSISQNTSVRGFSGAVGNVLIDGARPASKNEGLGDILGRIPASQVERIELIRGGAPGIEMQGFSQVVNVIRRQGGSRQHVVTVGTTLFDDGRQVPNARYELNGRVLDRIYELSIGTSTSLSDNAGTGRITRFSPAGDIIRFTTLESEADGDGLNARARLQQPLWGGTVEVSGNIGRSDFKFEQNEAGDTFFQNFVDSFDVTSGELSGRFERPLGPRWTGELRAIQRLTERVGQQVVVNPDTDQTFAYDNLTGETIVRGSLRFRQNDRFQWETGAEGAYNFLDAAQALTVDGQVVDLPQDTVRVEELRGEGFATLAWRVRPDLTVDAAMRVVVSRISQTGEFALEREFVYPKPRLLVTWTPDPTNQVRVRLEREVSQLNFGDFAASAQLSEGRAVAGNAELEPQKTWILEGVYERRFWGDGVITLQASVFQNEDVIDVVPVEDEDGNVFSAPGNIGDGTGAALVIDTTIPTDRLGVSGGRLRLRGSWVNSEVTDPTTGELRRQSFQSPFVPTVGFTQDIRSWNTNWGFEWRAYSEDTGFRIDEVSYARLEDYFTIFAEWKPRPNLSLRAQYYMIEFLERRRILYEGTRDLGMIRFEELREVEPESRLSARVRVTF